MHAGSCLFQAIVHHATGPINLPYTSPGHCIHMYQTDILLYAHIACFAAPSISIKLTLQSSSDSSDSWCFLNALYLPNYLLTYLLTYELIGEKNTVRLLLFIIPYLLPVRKLVRKTCINTCGRKHELFSHDVTLHVAYFSHIITPCCIPTAMYSAYSVV